MSSAAIVKRALREAGTHEQYRPLSSAAVHFCTDVGRLLRILWKSHAKAMKLLIQSEHGIGPLVTAIAKARKHVDIVIFRKKRCASAFRKC